MTPIPVTGWFLGGSLHGCLVPQAAKGELYWRVITEQPKTAAGFFRTELYRSVKFKTPLYEYTCLVYQHTNDSTAKEYFDDFTKVTTGSER